jgi:DNA-directed RNA polymerase specialized sigma24 family protein
MSDEASPDDSDDLLITRIAVDRDERALSFLMTRHNPKLKGHLLKKFRTTLREPEMDLAIQRAFMKIWRGADHFDSTKGAAEGWLTRITQNEAISIHRHEKHRRGVSLNDYEPPIDPANDCEGEVGELGSTDAWRVQQLEDIIENHLKGLEQAVARTDLASGGDPDIARLASLHSTSKNTVSATKCKVRKKIQRMIQEREAQRNPPKGKT